MKNKILACLLFAVVFSLAFTVSASTYDFGNVTLKNGSRGEAVMELQRFLNANLNLGLTVDGKLGPKTIAVIKKWQIDNGLTPDGLIGPKTKLKMNSMLSNTEILSYKQEQLPSDVLSLLNKNNINLNKLRKLFIDESNGRKLNFVYDNKETGYTFSIQRNQKDELGYTHITFNTYYNLIPVFTEQLLLHFGKDTVTSLNEDLVDITISPTPKISKVDAIKMIESEQPSLKGVNPQIGYYDKNAGTGNNLKNYVLTWKAEKGAQVVLNANTGDIIYSFDGIYY